MAGNAGLSNANKAKKDEFYTQLSDIELELKHYKKHFRGKTVFCNCDDPYESNFFKYFAMNFNYLGLKKLIATCYHSSPVSGEQLSIFDLFPSNEEEKKYAHKIEISEVVDINGDGAVDLVDVEYLLRNRKNVLTLLEGDGDFRSDECVEILKEADIVVTNPPFSLFREFLGQLIKYEKQFLIIGNQNAITYKEVFPLIKENKIWLGKGFRGNVGFFKSPYEDVAASSQHKEGMIRVSGVMWFTNMDYPERHTDIDLYKKYTPEEYPHFDNYDAINVDKTADIPEDYYGVMGVPITFLDKYNPDQFEILGCTEAGNEFCTKFYTNMFQHMDGESFYNMKSARYAPMIRHTTKPNKNHYTVNEVDGYITKTYFRIFIRRKHNGN